jgi:peptide deformylase
MADAEGQVLENGDRRLDPEVEARRRLALAQIRQYPDPVLRLRANEVEAFDDELARLAERMTTLMHDARGVGLAATQVGVLRRLFVFSDQDDQDHVVVNPRLVEWSKATDFDEEGCLSLGAVRVPVERHAKVVLEAQDLSGAPVRFELDELSARVVQHELDHLDGVLIIQRTDDASRREALGQLRPQPVIGVG